MRTTLLCPSLLLALMLSAQSPTFQWAETVSNVATPGELGSIGVPTFAPDGTFYVNGTANGPRTIVGDTIVGNNYLAKYDPDGELLWVRNTGGRVASNGNNGAYAAGRFTGDLTFAGSTLTAAAEDAYVAKYDANGTPLWARQMGGAGNDGARSVAVDGLGRVHVGGYFQGTATFGGTTLVATHDSTGFHATLDTDGNFLWAVIAGGLSISGAYGDDINNAIACDAAGNSWMAGVFDGTGTFGGTTLAAVDYSDIYVARFDSNGNCAWVERMGAVSGNVVTGFERTPSGGLYLYGCFAGTMADFGPHIVFNYNAGNWDIFLAHLDAGGSAQWAMNIATQMFNDFPSSLDVDAAGNAWVAGSASGSSLIGSLPVAGGEHFIAQIDPNGTALSATSLDIGGQMAHAVHPGGGHVITGAHTGSEFDIGSGATVYPALIGSYEGFIARYDDAMELEWRRRGGLHGLAADQASGLASDGAGNIYSVGSFVTTAIFCDDTLRASLATTHLFLNKRDANGACLWTRQIRCNEPPDYFSLTTAAVVAIDPNGDLLLAGIFHGTIDFGSVQLTSAGITDLFIAKYDAAGNLLWAIRDGGADNEFVDDLCLDPNGDIIVTGTFKTATSIGGSLFTAIGTGDGFIAKYGTSGTPLWSRAISDAGFGRVSAVRSDGAGNIHLAARFTTSCDLGGIVVSGTGNADLLLAKLDAAGNPQWATASTGAGWKEATSMAIGAGGRIYMTGIYSGTLSICTETLLGDPVQYGPFLSCHAPDGTLLWIQGFVHTGSTYAATLTTRPGGDVLLAADFTGSITIAGTTLTSTGTDSFLASFSADGDHQWTHHLQAPDGGVIPYAMAADEAAIHLAGSFGQEYFDAFAQAGGHATFEAGNPGSERFAPNSYDAFVTRFGSAEIGTTPIITTGCLDLATAVDGQAGDEELSISPNPVDRSFTISGVAMAPDARITLRDMTGREVRAPWTRQDGRILVDASQLPAGAYSIRIAAVTGNRTACFIKR